MQQEVAAAREANCLLKLAGPLVTTAANAAMEFDLSQVDMTKVAALFVVFSAGVYGDNVFEKCGINRDGAGEVGKPRYFNGKRHF